MIYEGTLWHTSSDVKWNIRSMIDQRNTMTYIKDRSENLKGIHP